MTDLNIPLSYSGLKYAFFTEHAPNEFSGFASDLPETRKGWPAQIETTIGNKQPLLRSTKKMDADGDIQYVRYVQANGCITLKIFNT